MPGRWGNSTTKSFVTTKAALKHLEVCDGEGDVNDVKHPKNKKKVALLNWGRNKGTSSTKRGARDDYDDDYDDDESDFEDGAVRKLSRSMSR